MSLALGLLMLACDPPAGPPGQGYESLDEHCVTQGGDAHCSERYGSAAPFCQVPKCGGGPSEGCVAELPTEECRSECGHALMMGQEMDVVYVYEALECPGEASIPVLGIALYSLFLAAVGLVMHLIRRSKWFQNLITNSRFRERMKRGQTDAPPIVIPPPNPGTDTADTAVPTSTPADPSDE